MFTLLRMRIALLCLVGILGAFAPFPRSLDAAALSCAPVSTKIGIIDAIREEDGWMRLSLKNALALPEEQLRGETLNFESYTKLAKAYIQGNLEPFAAIDDTVFDPDAVAISSDAFAYINADIGDIIMHGPPFSICDYGLNAFFDADGTLLSATVYSAYHHFDTEEPVIEVYPGRNISCSEYGICEVEINFVINGEAFSLSPGQSHRPRHERIESVTAIGASLPDAENEEDRMRTDPWGFNNFANYVITFRTPERENTSECEPYVCSNGEVHPSCTEDGHVINYFVHPCQISEQVRSFIDVPRDHPNAKAIAHVKEQGIVEGYDNGMFRPNAPINRAEFTKIIIAAVFSDKAIETCNQTDLFTDASISEWFGPFVCIAKEEEIIGGYEDGTFRPGSEVNFAEAAKIAVIAFGIATNENEHLSIWWKPYVYALARLNGLPASFSDPNQHLTRGDMAEIIFRIKTGLQ